MIIDEILNYYKKECTEENKNRVCYLLGRLAERPDLYNTKGFREVVMVNVLAPDHIEWRRFVFAFLGIQDFTEKGKK